MTGRPHALLARLLARPYSGITAAAPRHRLLLPASARVSLVVKLCDSPYRAPAFLRGAHDRFALVDGECARSYLEVWMAPLGAYRLLGMPVTELVGGGLDAADVDVADVFGAAGRLLAEQVRAAPTWPERFALVDRFLLAAADHGPGPSPEVARAWQLLVDSGGSVAIGRVAEEVGWSHQRLITRFGQQVGVTPKTAARLVRFERVLQRVRAGGAPRWERLAAEGGYADQAHLIREFRTFAGVTPTAYAQRLGVG